MLVLSRGPQDKIVFPNLGITVEILRVNGQTVRVGVDAPKDIHIVRHELLDEIEQRSSGAKKTAAEHGTHALRNQLNAARLLLTLVEKQLGAGQFDQAMESLHQALQAIDRLDGKAGRIDGEFPPPAKKKVRALLVEDDANESELLASYLRLCGYEVDTAVDGLQAMVQLARRDRPDVVLLDMHMPRMDGAKTIQCIRKNPDFQGVKVYAVTGASPQDADVEIGPRGVDHWFRKPIDPKLLVDSMNHELLVPAGHC